MPFYLRKNVFESCSLGIWQITEDADYFLERLQLQQEEREIVTHLSKRKRLEWFASRWTLHLMSGMNDRGACLYDKFGKPYLENSHQMISLSHSGEFVAVIAGSMGVGVDIQKSVDKIGRIKHKFCSGHELNFVDGIDEIPLLHIIWGAKESMYKSYGKKSLAFATHMSVEPFFYNPKGGRTSGKIMKDDFKCNFEIEYSTFEDYFLVYVYEKN